MKRGIANSNDILLHMVHTKMLRIFSVVMGIMGDSLVFTCIYLSAPLYMYMHSPAYLSATHFTFVTVDTPHLSLIVMVNGYLIAWHSIQKIQYLPILTP